MKPFERVYIIGNGDKPGVHETLQRMLPWLRERLDVRGVHLDLRQPVSCPDADLIMAFGGDGTILAAARLIADCKAPVLGVNLGRVGFLAEIPAAYCREVMTRVLDGQATVSERMMLDVRLRTGDGVDHGPYTALNDAVIMRDVHGHSVDFAIFTDGQCISEYSGDGLIIATPTGSTGYNLSANGPLIAPDVNAMVLTPICPFSLTNRPLVLDPHEKLHIHIPEDESRQYNALLTVDGQLHEPLTGGSDVHVTVSPSRFRLLTLAKRRYYRLLRDKLHWGRSVKREQ